MAYGLIALAIFGLAACAAAGEAAAVIPAADPRIHYVGRWASTGEGATSAWNGAYFRTRFSGRSLHALLDGPADLCVVIDGCETVLTGVRGDADLLEGRPPLAAGMHDATVAACWDSDRIRLRGLGLDPGATLAEAPLRPRLIEFVGASSVSATGTSPIYRCTAGFAWLTAERLGAEHRLLSFAGKTLQDRPSYPSPTGIPQPSAKAGLEALFFAARPIDTYPGPADRADWRRWDEPGYPAPDVIVCQLGGSNDCATSITPAEFTGHVIAFMHRLRGIYPRARLVLLSPWYTFSERSRALVLALRSAANAVHGGGDGRPADAAVQFIDATGWLVTGSEDFCSDKGHPSNLGHRKAAARLAEQLTRSTGIPIATGVAPTTDLSRDAVSIDDGDDRLVWLGCYQPSNDGWRTVASPGSHRGSYHVSVAAQASFSYAFTGTFARIHGPALPACSRDVAVTVSTQLDDGSWARQEGAFDQSTPPPVAGGPLYETPPLRLSKNGRHTITLAARDGQPIALDRIEVGAR